MRPDNVSTLTWFCWEILRSAACVIRPAVGRVTDGGASTPVFSGWLESGACARSVFVFYRDMWAHAAFIRTLIPSCSVAAALQGVNLRPWRCLGSYVCGIWRSRSFIQIYFRAFSRVTILSNRILSFFTYYLKLWNSIQINFHLRSAASTNQHG